MEVRFGYKNKEASVKTTHYALLSLYYYTRSHYLRKNEYAWKVNPEVFTG
jgi:hypothetical protein